MDGVTAVSSSGIIAKVLGDLHRLGDRETPVLLSVLVLEDLAMAVYLPVVTALLAHQTIARGSLTVAIALGALGGVLYLALRHGATHHPHRAAPAVCLPAAGQPSVSVGTRSVGRERRLPRSPHAYALGLLVTALTGERQPRWSYVV
jgi:hypothetical protein